MPRTALICDDDPVLRGVVATLVGQHGWEPVEAGTARGAIGLTEVLQPDIVILDVALIGMSGLEAAPLIRERCPQARIVVLSAFEVPPGAASRAGAVAAVRKQELPRLDTVLNGLRDR